MSKLKNIPVLNVPRAFLPNLKLGLRAKLLTVISLFFFATILVIALGDFRESSSHFQKSATSTAEKVSHLLSRQMAKAIPLDDVTVMFSTFDALEKDPENRLSGMIVLDAAGTLVAEVGDRGHLAEAGKLASLVDINGYAKAPPSFRVWAGGTVEPLNIELLLPWLDWAYSEVKKSYA